jgi:hypothetical protein
MASTITANSNGLFFTADNSGNIDMSSPHINFTGNVLAANFASTGNGVPTLSSNTNINLTAGAAVVVTNSPLRLRSFTTAQIANLTPMNGDLVYNSTTNQFQGYANNNWVNLNGNIV